MEFGGCEVLEVFSEGFYGGFTAGIASRRRKEDREQSFPHPTRVSVNCIPDSWIFRDLLPRRGRFLVESADERFKILVISKEK